MLPHHYERLAMLSVQSAVFISNTRREISDYWQIEISMHTSSCERSRPVQASLVAVSG